MNATDKSSKLIKGATGDTIKGVARLAEFKAGLSGATPAPDLDAPLAALWWAAKGRWDEAHMIVQDQATADAAWVHAYLHRIEGDLGNAAYWYRRAAKAGATGPLEAEWEGIAATLLGRASA
jgi:hypothetical protein